MKNFIALYYNTSGAHQPAPELTPEEKEQMMTPWEDWAAKYGEKIVDMGAPFAPASASGDGSSWSPSQNFVTGYSIVSASSMDEAQKMFANHPIYSYPDHAVEISECMTM